MTFDLVSHTHGVLLCETEGWKSFPTDEGAVEVAVVKQRHRDPVTGSHKAVYTYQVATLQL
jgi:hypothetical protein